ncbi:MAG: BRAMP, partial [uncultured Solirubrobacteraceae bacterium]
EHHHHPPARRLPELHAQALPRALPYAGADGARAGDHGGRRRRGRHDPRRRSRHRDGRAARHDGAGGGPRRLAGAAAPGARRRHPRPRHAHLARRQEQRLHAGRRAALRELLRGRRARAAALLRPRGRRRRDGQRGRGQARRDERRVLAPAPRLRDPAPVRLRLDRGGRAGPELRRPRQRRPGERVHAHHHGHHGPERRAARRAAQAGRRLPGPGRRARM